MDDLKYQVDLLTALNERIMKSERIYRHIADCSGCVYLYYDYKNGEKVDLLGPWDELVGEHIANHPYDENYMLHMIFEDDQEKVHLDILQMQNSGCENRAIEVRSKNRRRWIRIEGRVRYESGHAVDKLVTVSDVTKQHAVNEELEFLAFNDGLTGLMNRNYFVRNLRDLCEKATSDKVNIEILFVDIDDFKKINDSIGLLFGDELVQEFGRYLADFQSDDINVGRFGSDVFIISIYNPVGQKSADVIYRKICERLRNPFVLTNKATVSFTVSAGVAEFPDAGETALDLVKNAEIVLYKAKEKGKNTIQYFEIEILNRFMKNVSIEKRLKDAIDNEDFVLYYQPQFYMESGKLRGAEILLRWPDPNGGFIVGPAEFIPVAEKNGAILPIGAWVIRESMKALSEFKSKYHVPFILSVNISAIQIERENFVDDLLRSIQVNDINPEDVEIEITESIFINDFDDVIDKINTLRGMGIRISLDDFGTGYSSLSYLKQLPIDTLKIDKSFIDTSISDTSTAVITGTVVEMARKLGFETVAEGVETKEQLEFLKKINCDIIQGYLLAKPLSRNDFEKLLIRQMP